MSVNVVAKYFKKNGSDATLEKFYPFCSRVGRNVYVDGEGFCLETVVGSCHGCMKIKFNKQNQNQTRYQKALAPV